MTAESQEEKKPIKTVKLEHPYNFGEESIDTIHFFRRPLVEDMRGIKRSNMTVEDTCLLLGRTTNISTAAALKMDLDDLAVVSEAFSSFLPNTLRIGKEL